MYRRDITFIATHRLSTALARQLERITAYLPVALEWLNVTRQHATRSCNLWSLLSLDIRPGDLCQLRVSALPGKRGLAEWLLIQGLARFGRLIDTQDAEFDHSFQPVVGVTEFLCGSIDSVTGSWTQSALLGQLLGGLPTGVLSAREPCWQQLLAREKISPTWICPGLAFPHVCSPHIHSPVAALLACPDGVDWGCGSVRLVLFVGLPADGSRRAIQTAIALAQSLTAEMPLAALLRAETMAVRHAIIQLLLQPRIGTTPETPRGSFLSAV